MSFMQILNFLGGLALFLFGMNKMSDNLQAVAGNEMRRILKMLTGTPLRGVCLWAWALQLWCRAALPPP